MTSGVRSWGEGEAPALLLHCSLAHSGAWEAVARRLEGQLSAVAPDLVGHGHGPDGDPARDYHDHCTEVALAHLPEAPTHVIGHSFGATVAMRLAIEHPARVASLTLIEPVLFAASPDMVGAKAERAAMTDLNAHFAAKDHEEAARLFLSYWGGGVPLDAMPAAQARYMVERIWVVAESNPILWGDTARLMHRIGRITCPVLLLEGGDSPPVIAEILDALAKALPQAQRAGIAGAGHMLPISHAKAVAREIATFLDGLSGPRR